jgi:protease I
MSEQKNRKIAVLVANGFEEAAFNQIQRMMFGSQSKLYMISTETGLVMGWHENGWGMNYAPDAALSASLASDYDGLIVFGGQRSIDRLMTTAHSRRFVKGFVDLNRPMVLFGESMEIYKEAGFDIPAAVQGSDEIVEVEGMCMFIKGAFSAFDDLKRFLLSPLAFKDAA